MLEIVVPREYRLTSGALLPQDNGTTLFVIASREAYSRLSGKEEPEVVVVYPHRRQGRSTDPNTRFYGGVIYVTAKLKKRVLQAGREGGLADLIIPLDLGYTDVAAPFIAINLYRRLMEARDTFELEVTNHIVKLGITKNLNVLDVPGTETTVRELIRAMLKGDEQRQDSIRQKYKDDPAAHRLINLIYWGMR